MASTIVMNRQRTVKMNRMEHVLKNLCNAIVTCLKENCLVKDDTLQGSLKNVNKTCHYFISVFLMNFFISWSTGKQGDLP